MSCHWALVGKNKSSSLEEVSWKAPLKVLVVNPELGLSQQAVLGRKRERWTEQTLLDRSSVRQRNVNASSLSVEKAEQIPRLRTLHWEAIPSYPCSETVDRALTNMHRAGDVARDNGWHGQGMLDHAQTVLFAGPQKPCVLLGCLTALDLLATFGHVLLEQQRAGAVHICISVTPQQGCERQKPNELISSWTHETWQAY